MQGPEATWTFAEGIPAQGVWVWGISQDLVIKKRENVFLRLLVIILLANTTTAATQRCVCVGVRVRKHVPRSQCNIEP